MCQITTLRVPLYVLPLNTERIPSKASPNAAHASGSGPMQHVGLSSAPFGVMIRAEQKSLYDLTLNLKPAALHAFLRSDTVCVPLSMIQPLYRIIPKSQSSPVERPWRMCYLDHDSLALRTWSNSLSLANPMQTRYPSACSLVSATAKA